MKYEVKKEYEFPAGHRLLGYLGKCRWPHGHSFKAVLTFEANKVDEMGFVVDFTEISGFMKHWIDENLDHAFIINKDDKSLLELLHKEGDRYYIMNTNPTTENMAKMFFELVNKEFKHSAGSEATIKSVEVWESNSSSGKYQPNE